MVRSDELGSGASPDPRNLASAGPVAHEDSFALFLSSVEAVRYTR